MTIHCLHSKGWLVLMVPVLATLCSCGQLSAPGSNSTNPSASPLVSTPVEPSPAPATKNEKKKPDPTANGLGVAPKVTKDCPANAPIKGKANKKGHKTYHVPNSPGYAEIKPTTCFADIATAEKAGYKLAKVPKAKDV